MSFWEKVKKIIQSGAELDNGPPATPATPVTPAAGPEITNGGSTVYRYENNEATTEDKNILPVTRSEYLPEIEQHIATYIGSPDQVFHEIVSEFVHIDVHWVKPSAKYPYHILITSGMSDLPMHVPEGLENPNDYERAELMVLLPADWKISEADFQDDDNYWPLYFLKMLARFPHQYKTWLGYGHTIPNGLDADPIANTNFGCMLLLPPMLSIDKDFLRLHTKDGKLINFYALIPIYKDEMDYKLEEGTDALLDRFDATGLTEVIDISRPSVL